MTTPRHALSLLAALALLFTATARTARALNVIPVPYGCPIPVTVTNDTDAPIFHTPCPPTVFDENGVLVFSLACPQIAIELAPGESSTTFWPQVDMLGQPVPEGVYFVNGQGYLVTSTVPAMLWALGPPRVGDTRALLASAPGEPGGLYAVAASATSNLGTPLACGAFFPLDIDGLLFASLTTPSVFQNFIGVLDDDGCTTAPRIAVPADPSLAGISFVAAFAVLDPTAPCPVRAVSDPRFLTVAP